jgi:regulation of enolase protein 1 (concanavalin A-like superfamily)
MIRDPGTNPSAVQVSCVLQNEHGVYMYARTATGGSTDYHAVNWHDAQTSGWCKLEKIGNTVTGYRSFDGMNWDQMESITASFTSDTVEVGVLATGTWAEYGMATFENFEFS